MHGDQDPLVSFLQSNRLFDAIDAQGGAPELRLKIVAGLGHGGLGWDEQIPTVVDFVSDAFATQVAPVPLPAALPMALAGLGLLGALGYRRRSGVAQSA
jgi:hypothetical protein